MIAEFLDPAAALCRVRATYFDYGRITGTKIVAADLSHDSLVMYKFMQQEFSKLRKIDTSNKTFQQTL